MHGDALKLVVQAGTARVAAGGFYRNHDVAEKNPIARWIGLALQFLHVKAQHVGGAIKAPVLAIERTDLGIAGEHKGSRRVRAPQPAQGHAQAICDLAARGRIYQGADLLSDDDINGHEREHRSA
jgi:hypothetical protein